MASLTKTTYFMFLLTVAVSETNNVTFTGCRSPQYAELGETGYIKCTFSNEYSIYWRDASSSGNKPPIVTFINYKKGGTGYDSGEYDILNNGSLIINNVNTFHEKTYEVVIIDKAHNTESYQIALITTVTPSEIILHVSGCMADTLCLIESDSPSTTLTCVVGGARPPCNVTWYQVLSTGSDVQLDTTTAVEPDSLDTFRTISNVSIIREDLNVVAVFKCNSSYVIDKYYTEQDLQNGLLKIHGEQEVLIDYSHGELKELTEQRKKVYVEINTNTALVCSARAKADTYVWKRYKENEFITITYKSQRSNNHVTSERFSISEFGELLINNIAMDTEGNYTCISSGGKRGDYEVNVVVLPVSQPYIVIPECSSHETESCIIPSHGTGELQCSVFGVRPAVSLEWIAKSSDTDLSLNVDELIEENRNDLFTVTTKIHYNISTEATCNTTFVLQCVAAGPATDFFIQKAVIVTILNAQERCGNDGKHFTTKAIPRTWPFEILAIVFVVLICIGMAVGSLIAVHRRRRGTVQDPEERFSLMETNLPSVEGDHSSPSLARLVSILTTTYETKLAHNEAFVMNHLSELQPSKASHDKDRYKRVAYNDLFRNQSIRRKQRIILSGEAGYGKTSFARSMARQWISKKMDFPMTDVRLLIVLSMTGFKRNKSIPEAIVQQLIPDGSRSEFSEATIETILQKESKVVILLDGFDEYLERNKEISEDSYMFKLINNKILNYAFVIILTRPVTYLREYGDFVLPIVKLNPFTQEQIEEVIQATCRDPENSKILQRKLKENENISSMCEVPFFLRMIIELYNKNGNVNILSTQMTTSFRELIDNQVRSVDICYKRFNLSHQLSKFAFEAISENKNVWLENDIKNECGDNIFALLHLNFLKRSTATDIGYMQSDISVIQFTHNIYKYYLGAHFLAASKSSEELLQHLRKIDVLTCQQLLIFSCGLSSRYLMDIVQYLMAIEDIYPYPVRDCIAQCIAEYPLNENTRMKGLLEKFSMRDYGLALLESDTAVVKKAKSHLLQMFVVNKVTATFLRVVNLELGLANKGICCNYGGTLCKLPHFKTLIVKDFFERITGKFILTILSKVPTVTEIAIFSSRRPTGDNLPNMNLLNDKEERRYVYWILYHSLGREMRAADIFYPSSSFNGWLSFQITIVLVLMRSIPLLFGSDEKNAFQVMTKSGVEHFFRQSTFTRLIWGFFKKEQDFFFQIFSDLLGTWQKVDDASTRHEVKLQSKNILQLLKKVRPKFKTYGRFLPNKNLKEEDLFPDDLDDVNSRDEPALNKGAIIEQMKKILDAIRL